MKSVREAELSSGREIKEIYVGVPGDFIHLEQNEVVLDLESEAAHSRPRDVDDVMNLALDYKNQREGGHASTGARRGSRWTIAAPWSRPGSRGRSSAAWPPLVVGRTRRSWRTWQARMEQQDIHISGYLSPALGEALLLVPPEERDKVAVLVDVGYLTTEVLFIQGDALIRYKVLPMGGGPPCGGPGDGAGHHDGHGRGAQAQVHLRHRPGPALRQGPGGDRPSPSTGENVLAVIEPRVAELSDMVHDAIEEDASLLSPRSTFYITGGGLILMRGGREDHLLRRGAHVPRAHAAGRQAQFTRVFLGDRPARARLRVREPDGDQAPGKRRQDRRILQGVLHKVTPGQAFFFHLI